jgi:hypothetical protein
MRGARSSRREHPDLLARPPCSIGMYDEGWVAVLVDQAAQLGTLADLLGRGLLTQEEFERQKSKVLEPVKYRSQP